MSQPQGGVARHPRGDSKVRDGGVLPADLEPVAVAGPPKPPEAPEPPERSPVTGHKPTIPGAQEAYGGRM